MFSFTDIYIDAIDVIDIEYDWDLIDEEIDIDDDLDLDVDIEDLDDLEANTMDGFLNDTNFDVTADELTDFSADELEFEGDMEITEPSDFSDHDLGDFDEGLGDLGDFD